MPPGVSSRIRAAASSIASGSPSSAWQTATTAAVFDVRQGEVGLDRAGALDEELDGGRRGGARAAMPGRRRRPSPAGHLVDPLAADAQHDPARDEEDGIRRERVEPDDRGRRIDDLLEVVEHDEHAPAAEREREPLLEGAVAGIADAESVGDRREQQGRLEHVLERDEGRAVGEERLGRRGDLDREPALADPARAQQRDEAMLTAPRSSSTSASSRSRPMMREYADGTRVAAGVRLRLPSGGGARRVEALGEQGREVADELLFELLGRLEREVGGGVVRADAVDQLVQALVAVLPTP